MRTGIEKIESTEITGNKNILRLLIANFLVSSAVGVAMILIPWVLVKRFSGDLLTALAAIAILLTIVFVSKIGSAIDRFSRKNIMLLLTVLVSSIYLCLGIFPSESYIFIYLLGLLFALKQIYFNVFFTTRLAFAQSLVPKAQFGRLNGWLEIENQAAALSAGALALILLDHFSIHAIFITCGIMLIPAAYLFFTLPSQELDGEDADSVPISKQPDQSIPDYGPSLYLVIIAGNIPFVCVMLLDVIRPIFISDVLQETSLVLALSAVFYTVGAIVGGLYGGRLKADHILRANLVLAVTAFAILALLLVYIPTLNLFYLASFGWGVVNAVARVSAQTIVMNGVENAFIGRFLSRVQRFILLLRVSSMVGYAIIFRYFDYGNSFLFLFGLSLFGPVLIAFNLSFRKSRNV